MVKINSLHFGNFRGERAGDSGRISLRRLERCIATISFLASIVNQTVAKSCTLMLMSGDYAALVKMSVLYLCTPGGEWSFARHVCFLRKTSLYIFRPLSSLISPLHPRDYLNASFHASRCKGKRHGTVKKRNDRVRIVSHRKWRKFSFARTSWRTVETQPRHLRKDFSPGEKWACVARLR